MSISGNKIVSKANAVNALLRCNLGNCSIKIKKIAIYVTMVRHTPLFFSHCGTYVRTVHTGSCDKI